MTTLNCYQRLSGSECFFLFSFFFFFIFCPSKRYQKWSLNRNQRSKISAAHFAKHESRHLWDDYRNERNTTQTVLFFVINTTSRMHNGIFEISALHVCDSIRRIDSDYSPTMREPKNICSHGHRANSPIRSLSDSKKCGSREIKAVSRSNCS
jgi:hypothetical protein